MPVYIEKSGDLVGCYRCLTHTQTTEYSATQLVQSLKLKLSHAIIVIKIFDLSPTPTWLSILLSCGQQLLWLKKKSRKTWAEFVEPNWRLDEESDYWGAKKLRGKHLPPGGILIILVLILSAIRWHSDHIGLGHDLDHICHNVAF